MEKTPLFFNHFIGLMTRIDTIDNQGWLEGGLRYPACGKTINIFPILDTTDVDAVRNFT
jgi:hypothetical protein